MPTCYRRCLKVLGKLQPADFDLPSAVSLLVDYPSDSGTVMSSARTAALRLTAAQPCSLEPAYMAPVLLPLLHDTDAVNEIPSFLHDLWVHLPQPVVVALLRSDGLHARYENSVLMMAISWLREEARSDEQVREIGASLRLVQLNTPFLASVLPELSIWFKLQ